MKKMLSNPKAIIPIFAIIVFIVTAFLYVRIGIAPVVPANLQVTESEPAITSGSNVSLSFPKSGRVEAVSVKVGDTVKAGEVLAQLSAPDAEGAVNQAKGALDLAQAQYASLNVQYATTKSQQDLMVENAYRTLLSSDLEGDSSVQGSNTPIISGTYTCDTEGAYLLKPFVSGDPDSGQSFSYTGLESGTAGIKYDNPVPLGKCGLQIKFTNTGSFNAETLWTINIPNTKSDVYLANENAYNLAVNNRNKALADLETQIGDSNGDGSSVAKAQVDAAEGAYEAAEGAYQNNLITSPVDGIVTFVDSNLKVGQSVTGGVSVISISQK